MDFGCRRGVNNESKREKRVKEICKEFDTRVKDVGVATAGFELAVALADAGAAQQSGSLTQTVRS